MLQTKMCNTAFENDSGSFYNRKRKMILPKGSRVKHGTSLMLVDEIQKNGIIAGSERNQARNQNEEKPVVNGVYVGQNLSYYDASLVFTSFMQNTMQSGEKGGDVPIILEIELGEDCELVADEDVVYEVKKMPRDQQIPYLQAESERVWNDYESGVLVDKVIPSEWIKVIEYPILRDIQSIAENKKYLNSYKQDLSVLALAYWQFTTNATIKDFNEMLAEFKEKDEYTGQFTNKEVFTKESVEFIQNLNVIKNRSQLNEYSMTLWHEFTVRIDKLGLDFRS